MLDLEDVIRGDIDDDKLQAQLSSWMGYQETDWEALMSIYAQMPATDGISSDLKVSIADDIRYHPLLFKGLEVLALEASGGQDELVRDSCLQVLEQVFLEIQPKVSLILEKGMDREVSEDLAARKNVIVNLGVSSQNRDSEE